MSKLEPTTERQLPVERYLTPFVRDDLDRHKMVFIGGPRQVGKTTLSLQLLGARTEDHPAYLSWDDPGDRLRITRAELPPHQELLVFDEIHKNRKWRGLIKGIYDKNKTSWQIIIAGSARLDHYRFGGDSLQGRYHYYRLHPLTLGEIRNEKGIKDLLHFGGFPEPFLMGSDRQWKRWQREYTHRVIHEDLISLERVEDVSRLQLLVEHLPLRVGAPLSVNNLAGDLEVSPKTVKRWVLILENLYHSFRVTPFGFPKVRAVKKEQKLYLWDWSRIADRGARFENFVASHLLKYCHLCEDRDGDTMDLRYLRDTDRREIDFIVLKNRKPLFAVECKLAERDISPHIKYFAQRTTIPRFYQVHLDRPDYEKSAFRCRVLPFQRFARELELP